MSGGLEEVERIRAELAAERALLERLVEEVLEERGEVSAPDVRDRHEALTGKRLDKVARLRLMKMVRDSLVARAASGELRLSEVRHVERPGAWGLPRNYYVRARPDG